MKRKPTKPDKCKTPDCESRASKRGVCDNCYGIYDTARKAGEVTFEALVAKGLLDPPKRDMKPARRALATMKS